ncbi:MAG: shikimate dehydrogenase [Clostridiales Family XIII bacterium]|nr:shikimate dehydrogenase [Clostridiales Family XIII bacterium]
MGAESDYLVIGDPLAHTLSPRLHGALFEELRKQGYGEAANASYGAVRVTPEQLEASVRDIRAGFVKGFNVTIPHKQTIVPFLDELRGDAALAGAVNTVVRDARGVPAEGDNLIGYNTDMEGLKLALEARGRSYAGANVTVCGTGGAAAGVVCKAALEGAAKIVMIGRKEDAAARIREAAISAVPAPASPGTEGASAPRVDFVRHDFSEGAESPELDEALAGTDIFINATPLGMDGTSHRFASFCFIEKLSKGAFVYDLVYKPRETALVRAARERGLGAEGGLSMLVCQAMLSDELFLGVKADSPALYEAVRDKVV